MKWWAEGSRDHLIIVPHTSTYHATAQLALMVWLGWAGYCFIHEGKINGCVAEFSLPEKNNGNLCCLKYWIC